MKPIFLALAACVAPVFAMDLVKGSDHADFFKQEIQAEVGHPRPHHHCPDKCDDLTEKVVCEKLTWFADEADYIFHVVKKIDCGYEYNRCWEPVVKLLYKLEFALDLLDTKIDKSNLNHCWDCRQESKIALCYKNYATALIRMLEIIGNKSRYLDGEIDKYIVTAVNSLRAADYTFVYELVRRMRCEKYEKEIMYTQGATDGSTRGSIRAAFALFVSTPYITGDDFKNQ